MGKTPGFRSPASWIDRWQRRCSMRIKQAFIASVHFWIGLLLLLALMPAGAMLPRKERQLPDFDKRTQVPQKKLAAHQGLGQIKGQPPIRRGRLGSHLSHASLGAEQGWFSHREKRRRQSCPQGSGRTSREDRPGSRAQGVSERAQRALRP